MTKTVSLRDANQQFAQLVREVEAGEEVIVTRRGEAVMRMVPMNPVTRGLTPEQEAARDRILARGDKGYRSPEGWKFNRDELYDEVLEERFPTLMRHLREHEDK